MKKSTLTISLIFLAVVLAGCIEVFVDIKPQSCPNPLNVKCKDVLPVAILGTDTFDVFDIDVTTVTLAGVEPINYSYEDVSTPIVKSDEGCECTEAGPDGYLDLVLHFDTQEIVKAIESEIGPVIDGEELPLPFFGALFDVDTEEIMGYDCVVIRNKGRD